MSTTTYRQLKTNLQLCATRLKLLQKKTQELAQKQRKQIAEHLREGKRDHAIALVEHLIRQDYTTEAMEIVQILCQQLYDRFGLIEQLKTLDRSIEEAVASLIWVAPLLQGEVKELAKIAEILTYKYGKRFAAASRINSLGTVHHKLETKLTSDMADKLLVERYLIEIANSLAVPYRSELLATTAANNEMPLPPPSPSTTIAAATATPTKSSRSSSLSSSSSLDLHQQPYNKLSQPSVSRLLPEVPNDDIDDDDNFEGGGSVGVVVDMSSITTIPSNKNKQHQSKQDNGVANGDGHCDDHLNQQFDELVKRFNCLKNSSHQRK